MNSKLAHLQAAQRRLRRQRRLFQQPTLRVIANRIRQSYGVDRSEFAKLLGRSLDTVTKMEKDSSYTPSARTLYRYHKMARQHAGLGAEAMLFKSAAFLACGFSSWL